MYRPSTAVQKLVSLLMSPLGVVYGCAMAMRRFFAVRDFFGVPIVGIGNLTVGGNGKTPFAIALAKRYDRVCVVLRGYGRRSKGALIVSRNGQILADVAASGDEAAVIARALPAGSVIVAEDRAEGIAMAKAAGAQIVILDDAFSNVAIEKFDILLEPAEPFANRRCLPAGPYREFPATAALADLIAVEGSDFVRHVHLNDPTPRMILVTSIAKAWRLDPYLPVLEAKIVYPDHAYFDPVEIETFVHRYKATSLVVTAKDAVKLEGAGFPLSILELELELSPRVIDAVEGYLTDFQSKIR